MSYATVKQINDLKDRFNAKGWDLVLFNGHSGTGYYALKHGNDDNTLNWKFVSKSMDGCLLSILDPLDIWSYKNE